MRLPPSCVPLITNRNLLLQLKHQNATAHDVTLSSVYKHHLNPHRTRAFRSRVLALSFCFIPAWSFVWLFIILQFRVKAPVVKINISGESFTKALTFPGVHLALAQIPRDEQRGRAIFRAHKPEPL